MDSGWIGLNDRITEGTWEWDSAQPVDFVNWGTGEPNGAGPADCVEMIPANKYGLTYDGTWNDHLCILPLKFICEIPGGRG